MGQVQALGARAALAFTGVEVNACGRQGPCHCAVCNLTQVAAHDASTAAYCRTVGDVTRAERYEADVARIRRALARIQRQPPEATP
jgi:hypothetical protein